jgi:hypothetical protein
MAKYPAGLIVVYFCNYPTTSVLQWMGLVKVNHDSNTFNFLYVMGTQSRVTLLAYFALLQGK